MNASKLLISTVLVAGMLSGCASHKTSIYFKPGSAALSNDYKKLIKHTALLAKDKKYSRIKIMGFTDTVGSAEMNKNLASKRVDMVDKVLVKAGIDESKVSRAAYGEKWFHHKHIDEKDDEAMRRVDIKVYKY